MATFFLIIIYLAFISLGLPDSLLGAAWPVMRGELDAPIAMAGYLYMTIAAGTIVSSLVSGTVIARFGTGKITFVSCLMTACGLLGFAMAPSIIWLFLLCIPLGLGAGAVDSGLNNYVAAHYKAHHMSWLHCFWGVGATLGPIIMAQFINGPHSWRGGYLAVSLIQFALVILLFFTLPLWKRAGNQENSSESLAEADSGTNDNEGNGAMKKGAPVKPIQIKGVKLTMLAFLLYCGVEATMGLWGSSFLVNAKGLDASTAAQWVSLYYAGITVGRFITGFITLKVNNRTLIRSGQWVILVGALLLLLPLPSVFSLIGFILVGFGCAPIFPCLLHETPARFGKEHSQRIMGYQMATAYTGSTLLPPLMGFMSAHTGPGIGIFPFFVAAYALVMFLSSERINRIIASRTAEEA